MRLEAGKSNTEVMKRMSNLEKKVDNAKEEASEKDKRDEEKIAGLQQRLTLIKKKLQITTDQCGKREKLAKEQRDRTNAFKEAVGIEVIEEEPAKKPKTWSEIIAEGKKKQAEKEIKATKALVQISSHKRESQGETY